MKAIVQIVGADLLCHNNGTLLPEYRIDGASAPVRLQAWASRYSRATRNGDEAELFAIGREMFDWLNPGGWAAAWAKAAGPRELEIRVDDPAEPLARAILEAPWELLARESGYLADDAVQLFELYRRVGGEGSPAEPGFGDLQLMFMAAAPTGENPLSFEAEESEILKATKRLPLHLVVEESGCAQFLGERLDLDGPFEALHLSCHGDIHPLHGPQLALEDETGQLALVDVGQLVSTLGDPQRMPLVFLSACRTAEQIEAGERAAEPFVRELVRAGVANVLGWDGSVYDADALTYARSFYGELASLQRVPRAAAVARHALRKCQINDVRQGRHWHLARLYLGPSGGGALAAKGRPKRKPAAGGDQFLDPARNEVPVAGAAEFVGRRRATQAVLKAYRDGTAGVLIHGMGNLGKSSLAFRVSTRLTRYEKVVVFGKYDALSVLDRLVAALPPLERKPAIDAWRNGVLADPGQLADALEALLEGPLDAQPILLVVDDLERILEMPSQSDATTPVQAGYRAVLIAILRAFRRAQSESRLLITSRYRFSLPDSGGTDLAQDLVCVSLQPMDDTEREKQLRAAARIADVDDLAGVDTALLQRALDAAQGNPGLQAVLTRPILKRETAVAKDALAAIEHFQTTGAPPERIRALIAQGVAADEANAMVAFFKRMAFDTYRAALTPEQVDMLQACCLFSAELPIPRPAVEAAGQAAGVADAPAALDRLMGLGLVDDWGAESGAGQGLRPGVSLVAVNPLARPLAGSLEADSGSRLAAAALPVLDKCWRNAAGRYPKDPRALEVARLALAAGSPEPTQLNDAAESAARFLFDETQHASRAYRELLMPALARLDAVGAPASAGFLLIMADCAERLGETAGQDDAVARLNRTHSAGAGDEPGGAMLYLARRNFARGEIDAAATAFAKAAVLFAEAEQVRERAIARGGLADIYEARGEFDEALRIRREEQLPVFEKLGDLRQRAITVGNVADIYEARGELDEALRIRREEQLPVFEKLGDLRARAITVGQIADIYQTRGELDEVLRIRREEQLPVFEKLGDVRQRAITVGKIAEIYQARGELDEALRIRREEQLPVFEKLGDVRQRAITIGQVADIYQARGELDEALRIRREEQLPVFEKLGDVRQRAITIGQVAEIYQARGEFEEALRIRREEQLPVFKKLGDVRQRAITVGNIADIYQARGELDEALRIRREEQLPVFEKLSDVRARAITVGKIADIYQARGDFDEALRIRSEEELPVYEKLGDVRSRAITVGKIADIYQARGELDEALALHFERLPVFKKLGDVRQRAITVGKIADIYQVRGEFEEALRIRREEELPVYEMLGDVRQHVITVGKIANIYQARGELDKALALHDERLPIAEKLGDVGAQAHTRYSRACIRLQRGDHQQGNLPEIYEELAAAFEICHRLGRPDAIGTIGSLLAQVLVMRGLNAEALSVLNEAAAAWRKLGNAAALAQMAALRDRVLSQDSNLPFSPTAAP